MFLYQIQTGKGKYKLKRNYTFNYFLCCEKITLIFVGVLCYTDTVANNTHIVCNKH